MGLHRRQLPGVQGQAHDKLAKLAASNAAVQPVVYANNGPGVVGARVFDIAVDPSNEDNVFVALGPKSGSNPPPPAGAGNRSCSSTARVARRGTTTAPTVTARPSSSSARPLRRLPRGLDQHPHQAPRGSDRQQGGHTVFAPSTGGVLGVFDLAQAPASGRFVAVGDFKNLGATNKLNGVAIFS